MEGMVIMYKLYPQKSTMYDLVTLVLPSVGITDIPKLKNTEFKKRGRDAWLLFYSGTTEVKIFLAVCAGSAKLRIQFSDENVPCDLVETISFDQLLELNLIKKY